MQPAEILQKETTFPELLQVFERASELAEKEELSDIIYLAFSAGFLQGHVQDMDADIQLTVQEAASCYDSNRGWEVGEQVMCGG